MSVQRFLLWLFADYQRTNACRNNVVDLGHFINTKRECAASKAVTPIARKPMARALTKTNLAVVSRRKKVG